MARKIKLTDDEIKIILEKAITDGEKYLKKYRYGAKDMTIKNPNVHFAAQCSLSIAPIAWCKMMSLVMEYGTEVEWHGLTERVSENAYRIYDIISFPHKVTSVTVTSDQNEYNEWICNLDDDTFNHIGMHGHSHVNMGTTPSSVDNDYRENVVKDLTENVKEGFYVFGIWNKKNECTLEIYDVKNNIVYEDDDIAFWIESDGYETSVEDFVENTHKIVKEEVRTYTTAKTYPKSTPSETKKTSTSYGSDYSYGVYGSYGYDYDDDDDSELGEWLYGKNWGGR